MLRADRTGEEIHEHVCGVHLLDTDYTFLKLVQQNTSLPSE